MSSCLSAVTLAALAVLPSQALAATSAGEISAKEGIPTSGRPEDYLLTWKTILPELRGGDRIDTLLRMGSTYLTLGRVQEAVAVLSEAEKIA